MYKRKGCLFVVSGPSGVGKGTVIRELFASTQEAYLSISATTRSPREGEKEGVNYFFLSRENFLDLRDRGEFLEWAEVYGNFYGTLKAPVQEKLDQGLHVILEIDIQGARQIKSLYGEAIFVFVLPPSLEELKRRIVKRGSETEESLALRMQHAMEEILQVSWYDYFLVNRDVTQAAHDLEAILRAEKSRVDEDLLQLLQQQQTAFQV